MRLLEPISEDRMIAVFLQGELASSRFGAGLRAALDTVGADEQLITAADTGDPLQNDRRRQVFIRYRGWTRPLTLFHGFPYGAVAWWRATLTPRELAEVLYINWDYWLETSEGTRRPAVTAARLAANPNHPDAKLPYEILHAVRLGDMPAPLILVTTSSLERVVVLEGHVRLTAYLLDPTALPSELEVIVGVSDRMGEWSEF